MFDDSAMWFQGKAKKVVAAQALWFDILKAQIETGTPYMLYKVFIWLFCKDGVVLHDFL